MYDTPKFSNDPEQQAEMAAQYHFERRITGAYVCDYDYEESDFLPDDDYDGDDDFLPDDEEEELDDRTYED